MSNESGGQINHVHCNPYTCTCLAVHLYSLQLQLQTSMNWLWALVACCKPMEGMNIGNQLLDGIHKACHSTCGEEERHQEEVQGKCKFPAP